MIWRYIRLYAHFFRFSFSKTLEFRINYFLRLFTDVIYMIIQLSFFAILYQHIDQIGTWTRAEVLVFASLSVFVDALNMCLIINNIWNLPPAINKGEIDYYLVRPASSLFFLTLREIDVGSMFNVIINFGVLSWFIHALPYKIDAMTYVAYGLCILMSMILVYSINLLTVIPTFWTHSPRGYQGVFWSCIRFAEQPDAIYKGWLRRLLVSVVPFAVFYSFPSRILFEGQYAKYLLHVGALAAVFLAIAIGLWRWGLKSYASASS